MQIVRIDRMLLASNTYPAETRSNNCGRYTLLSLIYLGYYSSKQKCSLSTPDTLFNLIGGTERGSHATTDHYL